MRKTLEHLEQQTFNFRKVNHKLKLSIIAFLILIFTTSCVSKRKIIIAQKSIDDRLKTEQKFDSTLVATEILKNEKNEKGEIDDISSKSIQKILDIQKKDALKRRDSLRTMQQQLSGKNGRIKSREFKSIVSVVIAGTNIIDQKIETVDFVDKLLKQETFVKFNTATFFEAGGYKIAENKLPEAREIFSPIIDNLIKFINKFPKINLSTSIVASGYADGQGFGAGPLVDELSANLGKATATKEELNSELSRLRAEEVSSILLDIFKDKIKNLPSLSRFNTSFFKIGKGEDFPNKKIIDYQNDDERRRIVVIYWNAIPL